MKRWAGASHKKKRIAGVVGYDLGCPLSNERPFFTLFGTTITVENTDITVENTDIFELSG